MVALLQRIYHSRQLLIFAIVIQLLIVTFIAKVISPNVDWKKNEKFAYVWALDNCEKMVKGLFHQRWNTISNLGFLFVGQFALCIYVWDRPTSDTAQLQTNNVVRRYPIWYLLFVAAVWSVGLASSWFHASNTEMGHVYDVAAIYCVMLYFHFLMASQLLVELPVFSRSVHGEYWKWMLQYGLIAVMLVLCSFTGKYVPIQHAHGIDTTNVMISSLLICVSQWLVLLSVYWARGCSAVNWKSIGIGAGGFSLCGLGFLCRFVWGTMYCDPDSWFQFHALYHVFEAVGLLGLFIMFRNKMQRENIKSELETETGGEWVTLL